MLRLSLHISPVLHNILHSTKTIMKDYVKKIYQIKSYPELSPYGFYSIPAHSQWLLLSKRFYSRFLKDWFAVYDKQ